ncbi:winged helix-turn-helix transcriptional regulator [Acidaminobacter sp. JC074]|uniref:ArsR/SmtB family transcription factor n=1 Tax=Acidaminobacter sp. JC074 TaxID=2530199 RepID=UPI001F0DDFF9|nr:metalloregulator ArsR/SmtB family transcription factor [Acidaminobacter sp. JC074]MCH4888365.1 winged helix-turn-helix transcriptional regulator [Acidaminobacter sp. JC074]
MDRVKVFKALGDQNRLNILEILQTGEKCGCTLLEELNIVQSTLSHHMKLLVESNLVSSRKDGKWTYYSLNDEGCDRTKDVLNILFQKSDNYVFECVNCD